MHPTTTPTHVPPRAGIRIMTSTPGGIGRRERFILAIALGAGLGVTLVPQWTQNNLWPKTDSMSSTVAGFRDAVILTLSTGYRCALITVLRLRSKLTFARCRKRCGRQHALRVRVCSSAACT